MANCEQISTEVPLSLQTFDHNEKKKGYLCLIEPRYWAKPLKSYSACLQRVPSWSDCMLQFSYKQQPGLCRNQIMTISVITLHNENNLNSDFECSKKNTCKVILSLMSALYVALFHKWIQHCSANNISIVQHASQTQGTPWSWNDPWTLTYKEKTHTNVHQSKENLNFSVFSENFHSRVN